MQSTKFYDAPVDLSQYPQEFFEPPEQPVEEVTADLHGMLLRYARKLIQNQVLEMTKKDYERFFTLFSKLDASTLTQAEFNEGFKIIAKSRIPAPRQPKGQENFSSSVKV